MARWHHRLNGHESEWTLSVCNGQGGLVFCDSWGGKESDTTEWLNWSGTLCPSPLSCSSLSSSLLKSSSCILGVPHSWFMLCGAHCLSASWGEQFLRLCIPEILYSLIILIVWLWMDFRLEIIFHIILSFFSWSSLWDVLRYSASWLSGYDLFVCTLSEPTC